LLLNTSKLKEYSSETSLKKSDLKESDLKEISFLKENSFSQNLWNTHSETSLKESDLKESDLKEILLAEIHKIFKSAKKIKTKQQKII